METINIQFPAPDFSFEEIAKDKAIEIAKYVLHRNSIFQYARGGYKELEQRVEIEVSTLYGEGERLVCIIELLNFLTQDAIEISDDSYIGVSDDHKLAYLKAIDKLKYILVSLAAKSTNYNFDTNAYSNEEVKDLNQKIDLILSELDKIIIGQSALGDEIQELKDELALLKSSYVLGKKTFKQKATGIMVSYFATKGGDEVWEVMKPLFREFIANDIPNIVHKLLS